MFYDFFAIQKMFISCTTEVRFPTGRIFFFHNWTYWQSCLFISWQFYVCCLPDNYTLLCGLKLKRTPIWHFCIKFRLPVGHSHFHFSNLVLIFHEILFLTNPSKNVVQCIYFHTFACSIFVVQSFERKIFSTFVSKI